MSEASSSDVKKSMEQPKEDLPIAMEQLSVVTDNSRKSLPSLSDMPVDVVSLIIERCKYKEQLILRKVSKSLRTLVDKLKPACKSILIDCCIDSIIIIFSNQFVLYTIRAYSTVSDEIRIRRDDFMQVAFDDLASTLKNPKLELQKFLIYDSFTQKEESEKYCNEIQRMLGSLNHQVSVKKVELYKTSPSNLLSTLPHLKPGVLETISLRTFSEDHWRAGMDKVALLEQWKQAKRLELWNPFDTFPMEYATHFKRFRFNQDSFAGDKFTRIRDYISKLENFEQCTLSRVGFPYRRGFVSHVREAILVSSKVVTSNATEEIFHYSIPDSDYYFEFTWPKGTEDVFIVRKKRESH